MSVLDRRTENLTEASLRIRRYKEQNKEYFDSIKKVRTDTLRKGDLVLIQDNVLESDISANRKLDARQRGLYRIATSSRISGTYYLEDLDRTALKRTYIGRRLKKFYLRQLEDVRSLVTIDPLLEEYQYDLRQPLATIKRPLREVRIPMPDFDTSDPDFYDTVAYREEDQVYTVPTQIQGTP